MKITELEAGMVIEYTEDGDLGMVFPKLKRILFRDSHIPFFTYENGVESEFNDFSAVYEVQDAWDIYECFDKKNLKCIWRRPEKVYKGFTEITKAILEGKKLRCEHWYDDCYIHMKDDKLYQTDTEISSMFVTYPMVEYKD